MTRRFTPSPLVRGTTVVLSLLACAGAGHADQSSKAPDGFDLNALENRLERFNLEEHSLRRTLEKGKTETERLRSRMIARGRAYYRISRALPGENFMEHAVRVERLRQGLLSDLERLKVLSREKQKTDRRLMLLQERRTPLDIERKAAGQARDALLSRQERERAFQMAFSSSTGSTDHTAVYSAGTQLSFDGGSFESMRGRLPFPLLGRAEVERVKLPHAAGPGLILRAAIGTPARAVFAGRVAYADEYSEYGRTVIIDHGDNYFTVTAGLEKIDVRVGDDLPQNARLGLAKAIGPTAQIYFEIRRKDESLAPGEWLGI